MTTVLPSHRSEAVQHGMCACVQTFDGERCLYAALNDKVRHLLLDEGFKRAGNSSALCQAHGAICRVYSISRSIALSTVHQQISLPCFAGARGHDLFLDFVGKAFNVPEAYPDLIVSFGDNTVYAHKFLLAVRAPAVGEQCLITLVAT